MNVSLSSYLHNASYAMDFDWYFYILRANYFPVVWKVWVKFWEKQTGMTVAGHCYGVEESVSSRITKTMSVESCRPVFHRVPKFVVLRLHDSFLENNETFSLSLENSTIGILEPHQKVYRNRKKKKRRKRKRSTRWSHFFTHSSVSLLRHTLFEFSWQHSSRYAVVIPINTNGNIFIFISY